MRSKEFPKGLRALIPVSPRNRPALECAGFFVFRWVKPVFRWIRPLRFDHLFIAFGVLAGAALSLAAAALPAMKSVPALLWLLGAILIFDLAAAYIRGVPVMGSVPTLTRVLAFVGGAAALLLSGGIWG